MMHTMGLELIIKSVTSAKTWAFWTRSIYRGAHKLIPANKVLGVVHITLGRSNQDAFFALSCKTLVRPVLEFAYFFNKVKVITLMPIIAFQMKSAKSN